MASTKTLGNILGSASTLSDEPKKHKKKKAKKTKKEKLDEQKSKPNDQQSLKDCADLCDSDPFAQCPEIKKKKKKKPDVGLNEEFPLRQNKKLKLSKRHKQSRKSNHAADMRTVEHGVQSGPGEEEAPQPILSPVQKEKTTKKRVVFNLSPVSLESKPSNLPKPLVMRDVFQTQRSSADTKLSSDAVFPADGRYSKGENSMESQSTCDDINSQDLFITQKSFLDPYIDLCSSMSAEEALEPQGYTESCPDSQSHTASSSRNWSCREPPSSPKKPQGPACHPSPPWKPPCKHRHKLDASTQTENFFTAPLLGTSLRFRRCSTCTEEPLDLSLPKRCGFRQQEAVSKASEDQRRLEPNATDSTQSEDSDSNLKSKADLSQLKVVQTRLNESFFFRLKGEGDSPKPRSPLMKFTGSVEKKKP